MSSPCLVLDKRGRRCCRDSDCRDDNHDDPDCHHHHSSAAVVAVVPVECDQVQDDRGHDDDPQRTPCLPEDIGVVLVLALVRVLE